MVAEAQVILTDYGSHGWGVTSPDLPELVAGVDTLSEAREQAFELARFGGLDDGGAIDLHIQAPLIVEGEVFLVRARDDARLRERGHIAKLVSQMVQAEAELRAYADADPIGDRLIVAALPSDRLHSFLAALEPEQPVTVMFPSDEGALSAIGILSKWEPDALTLGEAGLDAESTVADLARVHSANEERHLVLA